MNKIILIILILLTTGCFNENTQENNPENNQTENTVPNDEQEETPEIDKTIYNDGSTFKKEYEALNGEYSELELSADIYVNYLSLEETVNFLNNDTGIIYFGRPSCPHCRVIIPTLLDESNKQGFGINYVDISKIDKENSSYTEIIEYLNDYLRTSEGEKVLYVPHVFFIKDGQVVYDKLGSDTEYNLIYLYTEGINKIK